MKAVQVGVIGIGNIGFAHASCIFQNKIPGMELVAVCDCDALRKAEAEIHLPGVPFYADYRDLLNNAQVDAVIVAVPHPMHGQIAIDAFEAGKHVLVEKPMEITASRARQLCEAAGKSGRQFGIMFNQRTGELFQKARELVRSGKLGDLERTVWIVTNWYRTQHYYDSGAWRATWTGEGGGVLMNQAPHQLDLWQWICGMPESVTAFCDTAKFHRIEVEDDATIFARFPGGATGVFITSTGEYPGTNRLEITLTKGKLVLEDNTLKWWELETDAHTVSKQSENSFERIPMTYQELRPEGGSTGHAAILQNFANSILYGEELLAPGCDGLHEVLLQNAAYLSAWTGESITLPFDEARYDALLEQHRKTSSAASQATSKKANTDYHERWQINW